MTEEITTAPEDVLMLPGWETSTGVKAKMEAATRKGIPVVRVLPLPGIHDQDAGHSTVQN